MSFSESIWIAFILNIFSVYSKVAFSVIILIISIISFEIWLNGNRYIKSSSSMIKLDPKKLLIISIFYLLRLILVIDVFIILIILLIILVD